MIWTACRRPDAAISPAPATRPQMPRTGLSPTGRKNFFGSGSHFWGHAGNYSRSRSDFSEVYRTWLVGLIKTFEECYCYRTVMIGCGSGSGYDFGKVLVPAADPDNIWHYFPKTKNCTKPCLFNVRSRYFPESWPLIFYFFCYILCCIRIKILFPNRIRNAFRGSGSVRQNVTVHAPAPQHCIRGRMNVNLG
jgi:hypothetical protein